MSIDSLTGHFPTAKNTIASGTTKEPKKVKKNGTNIYTFLDKNEKNADGYTHHLIQRPNGKYILKVDNGDHRHGKHDLVIGKGRAPLRAGGSASTKGETHFGLLQIDGKCVFICFGNTGGMEGSGNDRRSFRSLESNGLAVAIQHGDSNPIALNPTIYNHFENCSGTLPSGGFNSYGDAINWYGKNCWDGHWQSPIEM